MPSIFDSLERDGGPAVRITLTPEIALEMLEANKINRPIDQNTVNRIGRQIAGGKWKFNGDTIKVSPSRDILDGQHRLWAVIEAKIPVDTLVAFGIDRDAFDTIDTLRKFRNLGDTIALEGQIRYRATIGTALAWLVRYEAGTLENFRAPLNRVENSDVKAAFRANPAIIHSVTTVAPLRRLVNSSLFGFFHYVLSSQNAEIAEQMVTILTDPARTKLTHPFYLLRAYLASTVVKKDPVKTIALMIKASNAAYRSAELRTLEWRPEGRTPDRFPVLDVRNLRKTDHAS